MAAAYRGFETHCRRSETLPSKRNTLPSKRNETTGVSARWLNNAAPPTLFLYQPPPHGCIQNNLFYSHLGTKTLYAFLLSPIRATWSAHLMFLHLIILLILGREQLLLISPSPSLSSSSILLECLNPEDGSNAIRRNAGNC